jgi:hypothetical protein
LRIAVKDYPATMLLHDFFDVVETDSKAFHIVEIAFGDAVKLIENKFLLLWAE